MLRLDWLSQEVLGDVYQMTPTRPGVYLIKYPAGQWTEVDTFAPRVKFPCPDIAVAAVAG